MADSILSSPYRQKAAPGKIMDLSALEEKDPASIQRTYSVSTYLWLNSGGDLIYDYSASFAKFAEVKTGCIHSKLRPCGMLKGSSWITARQGQVFETSRGRGLADIEHSARNSIFERITRSQREAFDRGVPYHSLQLRDGRVVQGIIPLEHLRKRLDSYPLPERLDGKRILDIGAASGWNSFEVERRGADVVAVDCVEYEEFLVARDLLQSNVDYRILDVDEMSPQLLGTFDYVLFLGVLYHLRHPLLGLEKVCALTNADGVALIESFVIDSAERASERILEFYETDELGGQIDNWFGPTTNCLVSMCRSAGFARVELLYNDDRRAGVACYRRRGEPVTDAAPSLLAVAINNRHEDQYFCLTKDEYVCLHFYNEREVTLSDVSVEVAGFGTPPLVVARTGPGRWQANTRLPPGLPPGMHDVTIRTHGARRSNPARIVVLEENLTRPISTPLLSGSIDQPAPQLLELENTLDGTPVFQGYRAERMRCIFKSIHTELDVSSVEAQVDGKPVDVMLVARRPDGVWEINLRIPKDLQTGQHEVRVRTFDSDISNARSFLLQNRLAFGRAGIASEVAPD